MRTLLEKKVNYAEEQEAPMILGSKILKKLAKEWGKDSDIYYEIEDILIEFGSDSPRRLAMALKRVLTNYDMWESPYKGYVNKIEKWTKPTGKVNESRDEEIRKSRFDGLVEKIEYYSNIYKEKGTLSVKQLEDLLTVKNNIIVYGKYGVWWASFAEEILEEHGVKDEYDIEELYKDLYYDRENGIIYESYTPMSDEEYLEKFKNICYENDTNKITLYFEDVDSYMIEKRFGDRFKKFLRKHKEDDISYKAVFHTKNSGYGDRDVCVLYAVEYGGYSFYSTPLCELSFEEFDRLFRNFKLEGGLYRRNDVFMYESNNPLSKPLFRAPVKFVKTYKDEVFEILDELLNKGEIGYEDLEYICDNEAIYDEVIDYIIKETSYGDTDGYRHNILKCIEEYYEIMLSNHLKDIEEDEIKESLSYKRDSEEYDEVYDNFYNAIDDFLKDETLSDSDIYLMVRDGVHYDDLKPFIIYSLGMMVEYLSEEDEEFYRSVLEDAVNDYYNDEFRIEESDEVDDDIKQNKKSNKPSSDVAGEYMKSEKKNTKKENKKGGKVKAALAATAAAAVYAAKKATDPIIKSFQ